MRFRDLGFWGPRLGLMGSRALTMGFGVLVFASLAAEVKNFKLFGIMKPS